MHGMASHRSSVKVVATKDYSGVYTDEISFDKGDIFELIQKHSEDWWTGSINNRVGVFPAAHVKVIGPDGGQSGITKVSELSRVLARKWRERTRSKGSDSDSPPKPPPRRLGKRPVPSPPTLRFRPPPPPPPTDYQTRHRSAPSISRTNDVYIPISRAREDDAFTPNNDVYIPITRAREDNSYSTQVSRDRDDEVYIPISRARDSISQHSREDIDIGPAPAPAPAPAPDDGIVDGATALTTEKPNNCDHPEEEEEEIDTHREDAGDNSLELILTQIDSLNDKITKEQELFDRECVALDAKNAREMAGMRERHRNEKNKLESSGKEKIKDLRKLLERLTIQVEKVGRWSIDLESEDTNLGQELECPVCLVEMRPPTRIWQCGSGHTLCEDCKNRKEVTRCPTCRRGFTGRAIAMERLISTFFNQR